MTGFWDAVPLGFATLIFGTLAVYRVKKKFKNGAVHTWLDFFDRNLVEMVGVGLIVFALVPLDWGALVAKYF